MLAFLVTYILGELQTAILRRLHWLAVIHSELGQHGLEKLGLSHSHYSSLTVVLDFHAEKVIELTEIRHFETCAQRHLG